MAAPAIRDYLKVVAGGMAGAADADLVARFAASRDETAFELLVWRHAALVQRVCRSVLRDHHAAEDAAQATFLALARKSASFAGRGSVVGWLYRVARRVSVRLARQRARLPIGVNSLDHVPAPESNGASADASELLAEVARLPERYRVPVLLCFFEGLTHADAARQTGWPIGTVSSRLGRAKELLARRLSRSVPTVVLPLASGAFVSQTSRAAAAFVAGGPAAQVIPPTVLTLAKGATVFPTLLKLSAAAVLCAATAAGVWGLSPAQTSPQLGASGPPAVGGVPLTPAPAADAKPPAASTAAQRAKSGNNLKQILLAIHSYADANGSVPRDITDNGGTPLLSWRVLLLPYLEQDALARQFKMNEPWDSVHNMPLAAKMPEIFRTPTDAKGSTKTYYQGFVGPGTAFEGAKKLGFAAFTDGLSNTVGVIEAGPPVEWTKPGGIACDPKKPFPKLVGPYSNARVAGMMDGSVVLLKTDVKAELFRLLVDRADGVPFDIDEATVTIKPTPQEVAVAVERLKVDNAVLKREVERLQAEVEKLMGGKAAKPEPSEAEKLALENEHLRQKAEMLQLQLELFKKGPPKPKTKP
jgi:RNA polymerase sigma factor (sigma-70 family)